MAVGGTIREGADAFVKRQYTTIAALALVGAVIIGVVIALVETPDVADVPAAGRSPDRRHDRRSRSSSAPSARWPRASSACSSACARTSGPPRPRAGRWSRPSRSRCAAGPCPGFLVVSLSLLGVWGIFTLYQTFVADVTVAEAPFLIVGFGFGASFVALFAQLGGGIYTKAADVGSDLVGKVEAGIPEDDPRNAGVIADLVGDNVGDCAGRGADLFESTAAENIGAMILGVAAFTIAQSAGWPNPEAWIFFPLVVRAFGLLATIVAMFFVRGKETEDPMNILNRGYWATTLLSVIGLGITTYVMMQTNGTTGVALRPADLGLLLLLRHRRPGDLGRVRLHHPVLHGGQLPARPRDRRGVEDRPGDEHHQRHGGRLRDDARHRDHHRCRPDRLALARPAGRICSTPRARTSAASSGPRSRRWACS